jgi:acyl-CoA reductase-like NAD-dependent aldehyde dehydrogenase
MQEYKLYIDGSWKDGAEIRELKSPYDQKTVARVHFAGAGQVLEAISSADGAFSLSRKLSSHDRAKALQMVSEGISSRREELAQSIALTAGKPIRSSRTEVDRAVSTFQIASEESKRLGGEMLPLDISPSTESRWGIVRRFPLGAVAGITPFNFPLNLVAHKVAPAFAAGNTMLLRPASQVSNTSAILTDIIAGTDWPSGGYNFIPCGYAAADLLHSDDRIKKITFTGSPDIGWDLKRKAYKKRVTLELGGNAAVVIEPDADLDYALKRTLLGAFAYAGQICISIQRIYLHSQIHDGFLADLVSAAKKLVVGDPLHEQTDIGPMINESAAEQAEAWIREAVEEGAEILCGGTRRGAVFDPTILVNARPEMKVSWLEAFAPVAVVYRYDDFDTALREVNHSRYGLQAGIFTRNLNKTFRAYEDLDVGGVIVNDIPTFRIDHMPYGGLKESGFGREGLKYAIEEMTELKLLALNLKD